MDAVSLRDRFRREERLDEEAFHLFALDEMIGALRAEREYTENGHTGVTLLKSAHLSIVLEVVSSGSRIGEHVVPGPTLLQVLEGSVHAASGDETRVAHAGDLIVVPHDRRRELRAEGRTAFLWALSFD